MMKMKNYHQDFNISNHPFAQSDLVISKIKSTYHKSQVQAVGNAPFNRKWGMHKESAGSNMRHIKPYMMEAMTLRTIVEEIMFGEKMIITYSNDGSAMMGLL